MTATVGDILGHEVGLPKFWTISVTSQRRAHDAEGAGIEMR